MPQHVPPSVRPVAPDLSFQSNVSPQGGGRTCAVCGTQNPGDVRYCISCGSQLEKQQFAGTVALSTNGNNSDPAPKNATSLGGIAPYTPAAPIVGPAPPAPSMSAHMPTPAIGAPLVSPGLPPGLAPPPAPIAPMRVVSVGPTPPKDTTRVCGRCHGSCDPAAAFCKFCGAPLTESAPTLNPTIAHPHVHQGNRENAPASVRPAPVASPNPIAAASMLTPSPAAVVLAPTPAPGPVGPAAPSMSSHGAPMPRPAAPTPAIPPPVVPLPANAGPSAPVTTPPAAPKSPQRGAEQAGTGAAAPVTRGRLIVVARDGGEGPSFPITSDTMDIGREEGQVLVAEDGFLSPRHARLQWRAGKLVLVDLSSVNGIFLRLGACGPGAGPGPSAAAERGAAAESTWKLLDQDLILVGQQVLRFEIVRDAESSLGPASEHGTLLFGTPVGPRYARLCQRSVEGVSRDIYYLRKMETVLGRESGDIIFTEDPFLSRRHAAIRVDRDREQSAFTFVDLGSSNGCFVRIRGEVGVNNGDQFRVGQQLFRIELLDQWRTARETGEQPS